MYALQELTLSTLNTPNLRNLITSDPVILSPSNSSSLKQITVPCTVQTALQMLLTCTCLERAVLRLARFGQFPALPQHQYIPVTHQKLRYLELHSMGDGRPWEVLSHLFEAVSLPLLKTLSISLPWESSSFPMFGQLDEIHLPPKAFLSVAEVIIDFDDHSIRSEHDYRTAVRLLALFPNARCLQCRNFYSLRLREALEEGIDGAKIMPQLEVLILKPDRSPRRERLLDERSVILQEDLDAIVGCWRTDVGSHRLRTVTLQCDDRLVAVADCW